VSRSDKPETRSVRPGSDMLGVLGGMGPMATAAFYRELIVSTSGRTDQDHIPVVIWADPSVPDRTAALTGAGPDPTPWLIRGATALESAGATVLAIACNTAHAFLPAIEAAVAVPVLNMIDETCERVAGTLPSGSRVGVLATTGTHRSKLYQHGLADRQLAYLAPTDTIQAAVTKAISSIKAGESQDVAHELLMCAGQLFTSAGADILVAGCTELALVSDGLTFGVPMIDSTSTLAEATVRYLREKKVPRDASAAGQNA